LDMAHTGAQRAICEDRFNEWTTALLDLTPEERSNCMIKDVAKFVGTMTWVKQKSGPVGVGSFQGETHVQYPPGEQYEEWVQSEKERRAAKQKRRAEKDSAKKPTGKAACESGGGKAAEEGGEEYSDDAAAAKEAKRQRILRERR
jgi:hypothetical protein